MSTKLEYKPLTVPKISWNKDSLSQNFGEVVLQPLEPGFGMTFGNALRRTLLGGVEGAAVTSVIIHGVNNEFSVITGVSEDTMQVVLNIKQLIVKSKDGRGGKMSLHVQGESVVKASSIICDDNLEIVNTDHIIASTGVDADLKIDFFVDCGRGYQSAKWPTGKALQDDDRIYVDSLFSPVTKVFFDVEKTRVGENIDYDKLKISIHTNGSESPRDVFNYAVSVLRSQLANFLISDEIDFAPVVIEDETSSENNLEVVEEFNAEPADSSVLLKPVEDLELSVRALNCLAAAEIKTVGDLILLSEDDVANIKNFGRKSLKEVIEGLDNLGLKLGAGSNSVSND